MSRRPALRPALLSLTLWSVTLAVGACGDTTGADRGHARGRAAGPGVVASAEFASSSEPTLLACPTTDSVSASGVIDVDGGTVEVNGTSISVPAGAVAGPTEFTVTLPPSDYMEVRVEPTGWEPDSTTPIGLDGRPAFVFHRPVAIEIDYSRCTDVPDDQLLQAWFLHAETKAPLEHVPGADVRLAHRYYLNTSHLSTYALSY
jgi:hypothetical protein